MTDWRDTLLSELAVWRARVAELQDQIGKAEALLGQTVNAADLAPRTLRDRIRALMSDGIARSCPEVIAELDEGADRATVVNVLSRLVQTGELRRPKRGIYLQGAAPAPLATYGSLADSVRVAMADGAPRSALDVRDALGGRWTRDQVQGELSRLVKRGELRRIDRGVYSLPETATNVVQFRAFSAIEKPTQPKPVSPPPGEIVLGWRIDP